LLFSSHLLPDVEFVCDHVLVLGRGRLLAQGQIGEMKELHDHSYRVRVKSNARSFAERLRENACAVREDADGLLVRLPPGQSEQLLWGVAAAAGEQIRHLRPQKGTLEDVFLKTLEEDTE